MKSVARILGILGGIAMFVAASFCTVILVVLVAEVPPAACKSELNMMVSLGLAAVSLSIVGIVGGALAGIRSKVPGILMLVSGIGGIIATSRVFVFDLACGAHFFEFTALLGFSFAGTFLILGGVLALRAK